MANLALISSSFPVPIGNLSRRRWVPQRTAVSCQLRNATSSKYVFEKFATQCFASLSSSTVDSAPSIPMRILKLQVCSVSPILWIGVGVGIGLSALFSVVATYLKRQAIRRAFKIVMGPDAPQNGQFSTAPFSPGSPFPFPAATPVASEPFVKAEDLAANIEALPPMDVTNKNEEVKEAMSHESNTPLLDQIPLASEPVASEPPVTVDAPTIKIEASPPPDAAVTQVEDGPLTTVRDNLN